MESGTSQFHPQIKLPCNAADLRPICLTNTVAKILGRILIHRMRAFLPPCNSFQLGCQPDDKPWTVNTVKAAIAISNGTKAPLCFAKLDIKAAIDSLSHRAIATYLLHGVPNKESLALWDLLTHNEVRTPRGRRRTLASRLRKGHTTRDGIQCRALFASNCMDIGTHHKPTSGPEADTGWGGELSSKAHLCR